ncbi:hypothetical protein OGATHE_005469 [Ogataea polymorpha]|uniref:Large ribosomal subunit protein eL24-related N-terminal domain-containing protein n=2 Tax=Ogataea polymorpha TaxID=460523 RepID=A0A9P8NXP6_9ASCO|nr:hypothetical protein OGATHE_005469 [Ogataea polymorpha]
MKVEVDSFSGSKIYPGRGTLFVRGDSKVFRFQNSKSASLFHQRKNPRRISWTVLFRRHHKKGITEEVSKKRTRKAVKHQRAVVGASLDLIKERRALKPEQRKATREVAAIKEKEKKKARKEKKKAEKAAQVATGAKISKQQAKGAFQKVHATSRYRSIGRPLVSGTSQYTNANPVTLKKKNTNPMPKPKASVSGGVINVITKVTSQLIDPQIDMAFTLMAIGYSSETTTPLNGPHVVAKTPINPHESDTITTPMATFMLAFDNMLTMVNSSMKQASNADPIISKLVRL